jgi:serine/threonine protein kinase
VMPNKQKYSSAARYPDLLEHASNHLSKYIFKQKTADAVQKGYDAVMDWTQCTKCLKWRRCTGKEAEENSQNDKWECRHHRETRKEAKAFDFSDDPCQVPDDYEKEGLNLDALNLVALVTPNAAAGTTICPLIQVLLYRASREYIYIYTAMYVSLYYYYIYIYVLILLFVCRHSAGRRMSIAEASQFLSTTTTICVSSYYCVFVLILLYVGSSSSPPAGGGAVLPKKRKHEESTIMDIKGADFSVDYSKKLGEGHFATVYEGKWNNEDVAVKIFKGAIETGVFARSFKKEKSAAFNTFNRCENVVRYKGFCIEKRAIVMELIKEGKTLKSFFEGLSSPMAMGDRLCIMLQVAKGMNGVHTAQIIHKDLKPENVLISGTDSQDYKVKVTDFGISSIASTQTTSDGSADSFKSRLYSAPEQDGPDSLDSKVDVWSFGLMLLWVCACCGEDRAGEGGSLWGDEGDSKRMEEKKKKYCKDFLLSRKDGDQHLGDMLPCAKQFLENKQPGMLIVVDLVRHALHPTSQKRPDFGECIRKLEQAREELDFQLTHDTTFVYHTLEPGDRWLEDTGCLTRTCYHDKDVEVSLKKHVLKGSNPRFCSPFISCSLDFRFCVHYCQLQMQDRQSKGAKRFTGVILKIDVTKVPKDIKILDLSRLYLAEKHFGTSGNTDRRLMIENYSTCAEEIVFYLGKELESSVLWPNLFEKKIPKDAIVGVFDIPAEHQLGCTYSKALQNLFPTDSRSFSHWLDVARKNRQNGLNRDNFWDKLKEHTKVKDGDLRTVRATMKERRDKYWEDDGKPIGKGRTQGEGVGGKRKRDEGSGKEVADHVPHGEKLAAKKSTTDEVSEDDAPLKKSKPKIPVHKRNITYGRGDNRTEPPNHVIQCKGTTKRGVRCNVTSKHDFANAAPLREGQLFCKLHQQRTDGNGGAGSSAAQKKQKASNGEAQIADELQNPKNGHAAQASSHPSTGGKKPPEGGWTRQQVAASKDDSEDGEGDESSSSSPPFSNSSQDGHVRDITHVTQTKQAQAAASLDNSTSGDGVKHPAYSGSAPPLGWKAVWSNSQKEYYFRNERNGETTFDFPYDGPELPKGWQSVWSKTRQKYYFHNQTTNSTTFDFNAVSRGGIAF